MIVPSVLVVKNQSLDFTPDLCYYFGTLKQGGRTLKMSIVMNGERKDSYIRWNLEDLFGVPMSDSLTLRGWTVSLVALIVLVPAIYYVALSYIPPRYDPLVALPLFISSVSVSFAMISAIFGWFVHKRDYHRWCGNAALAVFVTVFVVLLFVAASVLEAQ